MAISSRRDKDMSDHKARTQTNQSLKPTGNSAYHPALPAKLSVFYGISLRNKKNALFPHLRHEFVG